MATLAPAGRAGVRRLYLDACPGETRGVVTLDGRPERLLIAREGEAFPRLGARYLGRVRAVSNRMGLARIELGEGVPATLRLGPDHRLAEGALVEAEVVAEPAGGKPAALRLIGAAASGEPGLAIPAPGLRQQLQAYAPEAEIAGGEDAREAADEAQAEAIAREHRLAGGLTLSIEPTRALVAVDVDLDSASASTSTANLEALAQVARLLRLKGLGGVVAIDLIGFPKDKGRIHQAALDAFAPDGPEMVIGPLSRFGVLELSKPRGVRPVLEQLVDADNRATPRTLAQAAVLAMEREGRGDPGGRIEAVCAPPVATELRPLAARLGPRFSVREEVGRDRERTDIRVR